MGGGISLRIVNADRFIGIGCKERGASRGVWDSDIFMIRH